MKPKDRLNNVLKGKKSDKIPAAPAYLGLYLAQRVKRNYVDFYETKPTDRQIYPLDHEQDCVARAEALKKAYRCTFDQLPDWVYASLGPPKKWADETKLSLKNGSIGYLSQTGEKLECSIPSRSFTVTDFLRNDDKHDATQDVWDNSSKPDSIDKAREMIDFTSFQKLDKMGVARLPRLIVDEWGEESFVYFVIDTPFSYLYDVLGFRGMLVMTHQNPELVSFLLEAILNQSLEFLKLFREIGADGLYIEEVYTGEDIISPQTYNEFVFPYNDRFINFARKLGLKTVLYVCGDVVPRLDQIGKLGPDALAFEESKKGFEIDLRKVVEEVGDDHCIFGNIDAIHYGTKSSPQAMGKEVKRQIAAGKGAKGFIVSNGSPFPLETEPSRIETMIETAHSYRCQ